MILGWAFTALLLTIYAGMWYGATIYDDYRERTSGQGWDEA